MERKLKKQRRKCVFTLIELLVVIAIIGILASMLLPSLKMAKDSAKTIKCVSNTRQVFLGVSTYTNNYDGYAPASAYVGHKVSTDADITLQSVGDRCHYHPADLSYGSDWWYYPMGFLVSEKYVTAELCRCPFRNGYKYNSGENWLKQVGGANKKIMSSYAIKILRWEKWNTAGVAASFDVFGYRPGYGGGDVNGRVLVFDYRDEYDNPLTNPYDIFSHPQPFGISVAREDGEVKYIPAKKTLTAHSPGTSDRFNQIIYNFRRGGSYATD